MRREIPIVLVLFLLLGLGGLYWFLPSYLPGLSDNRPEKLQTISEEEFANLLNASARRHQRRAHDHDSPIPDTAATTSSTGDTIPTAGQDRYDSQTLGFLEELKIISESPGGDTNFVTRTLSGDTTALSDYAGTWRLVNFWATWCAPCREEMPAFQRLQERYSDRRLQVLGVNIGESESTIESFTSKLDLTFTILLDQSGSIGSQYGTFTLPETWVIDPEGNVLGVIRGPREWDRGPAVKLFNHLTNHR